MTYKLVADTNNIRKLSVISLAVFMTLSSLTVVLGAGDERKAYCHATSDPSGTHYEYKFNKAWDTHFEDNGSPKAGHELDFYTVEGDEDCNGSVVSPTVSLTPTNVPTNTVTLTPTSAPIATPTDVPSAIPTDVPNATPTDVPANPTATVTPTVAQVLGTSSDPSDKCTNIDGVQTTVPDGWYQNGADSTECRQFQYNGASQTAGTTGQVLGASTSTRGQVLGASTLAATGSTDNYLFMLGLILTSTSLYGLSFSLLKKEN